jgi:hypothetical protein
MSAKSGFAHCHSELYAEPQITNVSSTFELPFMNVDQEILATASAGSEGSKIATGLRAAAAARKPDTQPSAPHYTDNLKNQAPNTTDSNHLYNTLELLMMGIMVPETC